ncbi:MAG: GTP-binding protein, partial [Deltaproteobacteria bacterium]|nr:GTP-binding protein [Deltaproteobacteria bacterium]
YIVVDTAGLRKKGRIVDSVEEYSTMRSIGAISNCDVAVLLVDAVEGPTDQDAKVLGLAHDQGKGIIIAVNKWDLVEKDHRTAHDFKLNVAEAFKFAAYAPHLFISALSGRRCENLLRTAREVAQNRLRRVSTAKLNRTLTKQLRRVSPPNYRGGPIKIYYASQIDVAPPLFLLVANYPRGVHFSYLRFVKNIIRDSFGFEGSDVKLKLTSRRAMD